MRAKSMASCTLVEESNAKPVWRSHHITVPKIERPWQAMARADMENSWSQFTSDLVHIGDHEADLVRR